MRDVRQIHFDEDASSHYQTHGAGSQMNVCSSRKMSET